MATVVTRRIPAAIRPYVPVSVFMLAVGILGFWASYFGHFVGGTPSVQPIIHLHAVVFVGWLLLVGAQAMLAANGRLALHIKIGNYGMAFGVLVFVVGVVSTLMMFQWHLRAGNTAKAQTTFFVGLTDIATFVPFLAAAWFYRRKPEVHKRLIIVATTCLLVAPVHRMHWFLGGPPAPVLAVLLIWLLPIYLGMAHDFITRRVVHPVYLIGIAAILYMKFLRVPIYQSDAWQSFSAWATAFYQ
jgi:hypothetical protein